MYLPAFNHCAQFVSWKSQTFKKNCGLLTTSELSEFLCLFQRFLAVVCLSPDRRVSICMAPSHELPSRGLLRGARPSIQYYTGMNQDCSTWLTLPRSFKEFLHILSTCLQLLCSGLFGSSKLAQKVVSLVIRLHFAQGNTLPNQAWFSLECGNTFQKDI